MSEFKDPIIIFRSLSLGINPLREPEMAVTTFNIRIFYGLGSLGLEDSLLLNASKRNARNGFAYINMSSLPSQGFTSFDCNPIQHYHDT